MGALVRGAGMNADLAQRVVNADSRPIWIAPSADGACVVQQLKATQGPSGSCFSVETLAANQAWQTVGGSSNYDFGAMVPDGVNSVEVSFSDDTTEVVSASNNVAAFHGDKPMRSYSFVVADGSTQTIKASPLRD